jgi:hypothetical protein
VNGKSYGKLSEHDSVHIKSGSVFINGKQMEERTER